MSRTTHHKSSMNGKMTAFKKVRRRKRKAKEKQAIKNSNFENVPVFKKADKYDYY